MMLVPLMTLVVITGVSYFGAFERSAWLLMTAPDDHVHSINSLWGYSDQINVLPIHSENVPFFFHLLMFSGGPIAKDIYAIRPLYSFIASTFVPFLGWQPALVFTNIVSWIAAIAVVYVFCIRVTGNRTIALVACVLAIGGTGFVTHVHDYSAHLMAYTFYFLAVYVIYATQVWSMRRAWNVHLGLGCFFAVAALQYNTGLAALAGYALASIRHNGLLRVGLTCVSAYVVANLWPHLMNALADSHIDYGSVEREYLLRSINIWLSQPTLSALLSRYGSIVLDFLSFEMPAVVVLGTAGIVTLMIAKRSFDFAIFVIALSVAPIMAFALYASSATARGYLIYQVAIFLYLGVAVLVYRLGQVTRIGPAVAILVCCMVVVSQLWWNLHYFTGALGPLKIYYMGIHYNSAWLTEISRVPLISSLTGFEATPTLFRGNSTVADAGAAVCTNQIATSTASYKTISQAMILRTPFTLLCLAAVILVVPALASHQNGMLSLRKNHVWATASLAALIMLLTPALLNLWLRSADFPTLCSWLASVSRESSLRLEVDLSPEFLATLEALPADVQQLELLHGFRNAKMANREAEVTLIAEGLRVEFGPTLTHTIPRDEFLRAAGASPRIAIEAQNLASPAILEGWQRNGLPGRRLLSEGRTVNADQQRILPLLEIRARGKSGSRLLLVAGF